ncbi:unnamed protein product [Rotaria socialis]|uniref:WWE domain-containing protein n=1 Tax=Rotaria socialis TaxID=392032 RepID=A0A820R250_9BILA|nr:unnamed protein product [Rotaria socialis]CAF3427437.1 unnamed protein product [Rotaria socialis]CAF3549445.1 unnamed protein product [Rotaria socialis]CAF3586674.1 unnamed protein product [Rotaria socialis]CAF4429556.1 unnamed protein product [Rotaria socialis]
MAEAPITASDSSKRIEWIWKSNPHPRATDKKAEWSHYSDIENLIIEEAFLNQQPRAMLDAYYIDFEHKVQMSNDDESKRRPVERMKRNRKDEHLREERFMINPIAPKRPANSEYDWISSFIIEVRRYLNLRKKQLPSKDARLVLVLVEKAADCIIQEGKRIGKQREAEKLANMLREKKPAECRKTMNEVMRVIGGEEQEKIWRSKVRTLGPFCLLLWDDPFNTKIKTKMTLYRGAKLTDEQVATYEEMAKYSKEYRSFQAFTSCSRNRRTAEEF